MCRPFLVRVISARPGHLLWVAVILFAPVLSFYARSAQENQSSNDTPASIKSLSVAKAFLDQGKVNEAERSVRAYLNDNAASGPGHFLLGLILFRKILASAPANA